MNGFRVGSARGPFKRYFAQLEFIRIAEGRDAPNVVAGALSPGSMSTFRKWSSDSNSAATRSSHAVVLAVEAAQRGHWDGSMISLTDANRRIITEIDPGVRKYELVFRLALLVRSSQIRNSIENNANN